MVTVFYWIPGGSDDGHAALQITGGIPTGPVHLGWWPSGDKEMTTQRFSYLRPLVPNRYLPEYETLVSTPGIPFPSLEDDISGMQGRPPDRRFRLQGLNETAMKAWLKKLSDPKGPKDPTPAWDTLSNNSCTAVVACLDAGGAASRIMSFYPMYLAPPMSPPVWHPSVVLLYLQSLEAALAASMA